MNVSVEKQRLVEELRILNKIVPNKPPIQILSHILLTAEGEKLSFFATDLEVGIASSCEATIATAGAIVVPAQKLLALVEQFPDEDVFFTASGLQVVVKCGKFNSRLQVMPAEDFPQQPQAEGDPITLPSAGLKQALQKTRYAVKSTGPQTFIQGALFKIKEGGAAMVATDGKRLALTSMRVENGIETQLIIPVKTMDVLEGQLANGDATLRITKNHLFFEIADRLLLSRVIDGKFPKYESIIPKENSKVVEVNREQLAACLRRVNQVADENDAVIFDIGQDELRLSSSSIEVGSADEVIEVKYDGAPLKVCVNGNYVLDFANAGTMPTVTVALKDFKSPMLLQDGPSTVGVVMLMKVAQGT